MIRSAYKFKIFDTVICFYAIFVMNDFSFIQIPAKMLLHNVSMFLDPSAYRLGVSRNSYEEISHAAQYSHRCMFIMVCSKRIGTFLVSFWAARCRKPWVICSFDAKKWMRVILPTHTSHFLL